MAIGNKQKHGFEFQHPEQERFPMQGMPGMEGTAKPIDHPHVTTHPAARRALDEYGGTTGYYGEPCYGSGDSVFKIKGHGPGLQSPEKEIGVPAKRKK